VTVDLRERELLAQLVALPLIARLVDRLRVKERLPEPVEFLLYRFTRRSMSAPRFLTSDVSCCCHEWTARSITGRM
jgi:hypothetical protein